MSLIKKENICIAEEYTDRQGQNKKLWKTIGEIVTIQGNDGPYQIVKLWGPGGFVDAKVYPQESRRESPSGTGGSRSNVNAAAGQHGDVPAQDEFGDERIPF